MRIAELANDVFDRCVADYHIQDNVDSEIRCPYAEGSVEAILYAKNRIDTVQWHLEDLIRDPEIDPRAGMALKHRIDHSNQERTDMVEALDTWFMQKYRNVSPKSDARLNTESPAWAIDRLSILALKIMHMREQAERKDVLEEHRARSRAKLDVLLEQRRDLSRAIDELLEDIESGKKYMKVYRQMKLYNDPATNPVLYGKKK